MRAPSPILALAAGLLAASLAACSGGGAPEWHEGEGYRWAELSPGFWGRAGFDRLDPSRTGVDFVNPLSDEEIARDRHTMNGSGVATGDVDGDGWPDVYFAGLGGPNRLYRNLGGLRFEDVTDAAGVAHAGRHSTGVVLADADGDGDLDLLVASLHEGVTLYLNDGTGRFEAAPGAGLDATAGRGNTTLALADVDGDGDLDLYVTNYRERNVNDVIELRELGWEDTVDEVARDGTVAYRLRPPFDRYFTILEREGLPPERREAGEPDQLFLNDGAGRFAEAGDPASRFLAADGSPMGLPRDWGLTAAFRDLDGDRRPDLWVANDFWTPDRIWMNQGEGVFREVDPLAIRNLPFSSMAVDFSDVDRDGTTDIFLTEMLSAGHERRTRHHVPEGPWPGIRFETEGRPQYNANALYLGRGDGTWAEAAWYAGVEATEWSWAPRFLDVDLDGFEDLLVTNGFSRDLQDLDTQLRMNQDIARGARSSLGHLADYPPLPQVNDAFRNNGDRTFTRTSAEWGFEEEDISHGLAVADFDGDGDLDLAVNRLNQPAAIWENTGRAPRVAVRLLGAAPNTGAVGATVALRGGPVLQVEEIAAGGGYLSGSDALVVFAAGKGKGPRSLEVTWPGGGSQVVEDVRPNRIYEVREPPASAGAPAGAPADAPTPAEPSSPVFEDVSPRLAHRHHEAPYDDFRVQPLLPVQLTRQGPGVAWIDVDRDGDEDLLVTTGRGGRVGAFRNEGEGRFSPLDLGPVTEEAGADRTALVGWAEGDATRIVVGSQNFEPGDVELPSALHYVVEGPEARAAEPVAGIVSTTGPLAAADVDGDGDVDLFVGARYVPAAWPAPATSRMLRNEDGRFVPDPSGSSPFQRVGLVTGAVFTDFDGDGDPDLLLSLEWGSLRLFRNDGGRFADVTEAVGLASHTGWWNGVATGDFDGDGRPDIVATNWGRNSPYRRSGGRPPRMYYDDFNWDGRMDVIEAYFDPVSEAWVPRRQLHDFQSIPNTVMSKFRSHGAFAAATLEDILGYKTESTPFREIEVLEHTIFLNREGGFEPRALPSEAQLALAFAPVVADYDNDGFEDLFLSQNLFAVRPTFPRLDAGRGLWLKGDGEGGFTPVPGHVSGVMVWGEQRGAAVADMDGDGRVDLAVAQNGAGTKLYRNRTPRAGLRVRLQGPPANRTGVGAAMRVVHRDGTRGPLREVQAGSGYWSQNGAVQVLGAAPGKAVDAVEVVWPGGTVQRVPVDGGRGTVTVVHPG